MKKVRISGVEQNAEEAFQIHGRKNIKKDKDHAKYFKE